MVAVLGDPPAFPHGPPPWPRTTRAIREALLRALSDHHWGTYDGPHTERLQQALRSFYRTEHVFLTGSGTYGIELALRAAGVRLGDRVVMAAYDFPGNFLTVLALGATPLLVDVDEYGRIDVDQARAALAAGAKAVIVSHLHGVLGPIERLRSIADQHGAVLVEDAAQMPGATVGGRRVGTWGHLGVLSFGGSKLLSAGRGGAVLTDIALYHQRIRLAAIRANDIVCPLSQLQAAVLLPQLEELEQLDGIRAAAVERLYDGLQEVPGLRPLWADVDGRPGYYKVGLLFDSDSFAPLGRDAFLRAAQAEGIGIAAGFRALHAGRSTRRYQRLGPLRNAERFAEQLVLLHHPVLLEPPSTLDRLIQCLADIYEQRDRVATAVSQSM